MLSLSYRVAHFQNGHTRNLSRYRVTGSQNENTDGRIHRPQGFFKSCWPWSRVWILAAFHISMPCRKLDHFLHWWCCRGLSASPCELDWRGDAEQVLKEFAPPDLTKAAYNFALLHLQDARKPNWVSLAKGKVAGGN